MRIKWIRIDEFRYVNEDQLRDIQFVKKGSDEFFYRLFYSNGQSLDIKGFVKDTYGYKAKEFEWIGHSVEEKVKNG